MTRIAIVEREKCNPVKCGNLCIKLCPINRTGNECITLSKEHGKAAIDEALCTGCGICPKRCPFQAIHIINLPEELDRPPIHKYGNNEFHLYNLPTPIFGKVVGILGKNGIGKSTAIKIFAGALKPNMGDISNEGADLRALINFFKGTEAQIFFEKLRDGEIKVAYKPQQVDIIPRHFSGTVRQLLEKADEKESLPKIVGLLELEKILDHDIKVISGGELQRVAIAATVLKDANVYIFDEPTSYLDIKQRLKIAKFIQGLATDDTAILVVEHDLIILDYMAELVHLMYGKPGCFGVVSQPKTTRVGINVYLSGYLREENIRFRDYEIKFSEKPPLKKRAGTVLASWSGIKKKLGAFTISADDGAIVKNEVIGVLGANGIGKTSFVKILAGVVKEDEGAVAGQVKVSYKPQYLDSASDKVVADVLQRAVQDFANQLIHPLEIEPLLVKRMSTLSGGELQRVAIAYALSQDAQLFLLDEPSAYLDVEQRLVVSKVIADLMEHKGCSALVVDHDLLFVDYLSRRLLVFDGIPAESGHAKGPFDMEAGMNMFLSDLQITFRRDKESHRPRANKLDSQMDREQKREHKLYYT